MFRWQVCVLSGAYLRPTSARHHCLELLVRVTILGQMVNAKLNDSSLCATGTNADVTALVLAGGRSRRFGSDKALATIPGSEATFLEHAIQISCPIASRVLISAPLRSGYAGLGDELVEDLFPGEGPAGGVVSALTRIEIGRLLVLACDQIKLTTDLLALLLVELNKGEVAVFADLETIVIHPLPFAIDVESTRTRLISAFLEGERSLGKILTVFDLALVSLPSDQSAALFDVDSVDDLNRASKIG